MHKRLKASALFYATTVSLLIGLVMGSMILLTHFRNIRSQEWIAHERAASNARSAAYFALHNSDRELGSIHVDLFQNGSDSATINVIPWGGLDLIKTRAWIADQEASITAFGGFLFDDQVVLDLARKAGPLHMCGDARIHGDVRVPLSDVRRGYIEGKPFTGEKLVNGQLFRSEDQNRSLRKDLESRLQQNCTRTHLEGEYPIELPEDHRYDNLGGSSPTLPVLQFHGRTHLEGYDLKGPILIRCDDSLSIDATNQMEMVIIQAPFITIDPGTRLTAQLFSTQGIHLSEDVQLLFPSMLAVWRDEHLAAPAFIRVGENAHVQGAVIAVDRSTRGRSQGNILIGSGALVQGEVYTDGSIQHQGHIRGTTTAGELILRTSASVYQGHLLDGTIQRYDLGSQWGFGCMTHSEERNILQWGRMVHARRRS